MPDGHPPTPRTIRDIFGIIAAGLAPETDRAALAEVAARYAVAIPPTLLAQIETPDDPLGLQFIPHASELITAPHELTDPVGDEALSPIPGVVHRYPDRALLKPLLACPVYCRFCFRREQVGPDGGVLTGAELDQAINYFSKHTELKEIILTGGDPLILSPRRLGDILHRLATIPHIEVLRIHSRVPVASPELMTAALADALDIDKPLCLASHINHAREITQGTIDGLRRLQRRGVALLGQTVLLAGVNDDETVLADLFRAMLRARIKPYYLHQLDAAPGTARFHVPPERGRALLAALRGRISGTAIPTYIYDRPGGIGKIPL